MVFDFADPRIPWAMIPSIDRQQILAARDTARADLLAERTRAGHWVGHLSSSPLSTATAISALVIAEQYGSPEQHGRTADRLFDANQIFQSDLSELIVQSLHWLACHQNEDGGWGDTDKSGSNVAATMLVNAAFHLTGVPAKYSGLLERAEKYIHAEGGVATVRKRFGQHKSFAVPILANCALAGLVPWKEVSPFSFELAAAPHSWYRVLQFPAIRYAIPAAVAVGLARFHHAPPWNPLTRVLRNLARPQSLAVLERMQPESGGFLESTPMTSFVVMCLASIGLAEHSVVRRGVGFLLASVRGDGSWPIYTNLATANTTLAMNALQGAGGAQRWVGSGPDAGGPETLDRDELEASLEWLLACQHSRMHPFSGAAPGGWAWTDLSGGVPNVEDTAGALLVLADSIDTAGGPLRRRIETAARRAVRWLLSVQNHDGGWPTFCRGRGHRPYDQSASDLTADALRALASSRKRGIEPAHKERGLARQIDKALDRGLAYLQDQQRIDGSWVPLWFGNQVNPNGENPVYGTSRVLMALAALGYQDTEMARRGVEWLCRVQHACGGWGPITAKHTKPDGRVSLPKLDDHAPARQGPSVEETSLAITALLHIGCRCEVHHHAVDQGLAWLVDAINNGRHLEPAPIGFYLAKLWYYERLYPRIFATEALQLAARVLSTMDRSESRFQPTPLQPTSLSS
jgi:squalene-hopene/tetraprenyl-beta-curcumene cyclase